MNFTDYLQQEILILSPQFHATILQPVKLVGVEQAGIWFESQSITNIVLEKFNAQAVPRTLVFFLPYSELHVAIATVDAPSLHEKAFGV